MAELAVALVIDKLIPVLNREVELLRSYHREVADIKDELESIRAFLRDADARALSEEEVNESVRTWVRQVRETAYQIEDVLDEYMLHSAQPHNHHGILSCLQETTCFVKKLKPRLKSAAKIRNIRTSINAIKERSERYGFKTSNPGETSSIRSLRWHDPRVGSLFIEDSELVGIEHPRDELGGLLVDGASSRMVISVVGMGGVGKTTLVKKVYDNQTVKVHFDCHAWITVSQSYKKEEVLRSMLAQFHEEKEEPFSKKIDTMDYTSLVSQLNEYLSPKRYLVGFDDVWKIDFWADIEHALLNNNRCSRIIITTRNKGVADFCKKSSFVHIHMMEPLPFEMAWDLFCRTAFRFDCDGLCPKELEELSSDIVKRCGGLPLAIVAIGGLLATKEKIVSEWQKLQVSLGSALVSNPHLQNITKVLSFSYDDLPSNLKSCFLYFGLFPEDYSIRSKRLIRLWISEDYVKATQGMTLEEVAEEYLTELIHRSLVQVDKVTVEGKPRTCRVHDLIREVILSRSEELSFCQVSVNCLNFNGIARHLSMCNKVNNTLKCSTNSQTRSFIVFEVDTNDMENRLIHAFFTNNKLLKSLDFGGTSIDYIPNEMGNLLNLRYLSLRSTKVKTLPKSIGRLCNLETLDLRYSLVCVIPIEIDRLPKLQHLLGYSVNEAIKFGIDSLGGLKIKGSVGRLQFLQKLKAIEVDHDMGLISELGMLRQLRKLGITKLKREYGMAMCSALENMTHLQSLSVAAASEDELLDLQSISSPPILLRSLDLCGQLEKLPDWVSRLKNLAKIHLFWSRLINNPLIVLQALPNLVELIIHDGYNLEQLHFAGGGFQKLKELYLWSLTQLNTVIIDEGALPLLEALRIGSCPQLKEVPSGIHHLKNLKTLKLRDMPKELAQRMVPDEGQDYWIVEHIPSVYFSYATEESQI